jgi:hypothetical protein
MREAPFVGVPPHVGVVGTLAYLEHVIAPPAKKFLERQLQ